MSELSLRPISVLVVDDEAPARQRLVDLLHTEESAITITEATGGAAAVAAIDAIRPDVVFLDIQMPEVDGFSVIRAVGAERMPLTVFVTAFDQHAVRAFEACALDYLLKPFGDERFRGAMKRVRERLKEGDFSDFGRRMIHMVTQNSSATTYWDRLVIKAGGTTRFVRIEDIEWIEAAGVYVTLHVAGKEILYRTALQDLAANLDPKRFVRIHRSAIINIDCISHLEPVSHGEYEAVLRGGARIRVSRTFRALLESRLGQSL